MITPVASSAIRTSYHCPTVKLLHLDDHLISFLLFLDLEVYQTQIAPSPCAMSSQPMRNSCNSNIDERSKYPTSSLAPLHFKVTSLPSLPILDMPATQDPWLHCTSWSTCVRYKNVVASLCCEGRQVKMIYFEENLYTAVHFAKPLNLSISASAPKTCPILI